MKKLMIITAATVLVMCLLVPVSCAGESSGEVSEGARTEVISPDWEEGYKNTGNDALPVNSRRADDSPQRGYVTGSREYS